MKCLVYLKEFEIYCHISSQNKYFLNTETDNRTVLIVSIVQLFKIDKKKRLSQDKRS